jgi:Peptidase MA superfamily
MKFCPNCKKLKVNHLYFYLSYFLLCLALPVFFVPGATATALPGNISITANKVTPGFPEKITFELKATLPENSPYDKVELNFRQRGEVGSNIHTELLAGKGGSISLSHSYDTRANYVPPGTGFRYFWTFYDRQGNAYDTPSQEFTYHDLRFSFRETKKDFITVRWYQGSDDFGRSILDKAIVTAERLGKQFGVKLSDPINITVYPDQRTMYTALSSVSPEWVGGQATPAFGTIVLAIAPGDNGEIGRTVPHEVSHLVIYQATKNPYNYAPKWLDEGLAVLAQDNVDGFLVQAFQRAFDNRSLQSLRVLGSSFPADTQLSNQSYGESVNAVQFLIKTYGEEKVGQFLRSFSQGVSYDEATQAAFGLTLDELDRKWKEATGYPLPPVPNPLALTVTAPAVNVNTPVVRPTATPRPTVAEPTATMPIFNTPEPIATLPVAPPVTITTQSDLTWLWVSVGIIGGLSVGAIGVGLARLRK